ncbi:MAG: GNAT family N-acetyltransferase [Thermoplasmata archaeon]|nr:GNAT family N-acetyltransferase [Thermoplasmata archaeon]
MGPPNAAGGKEGPNPAAIRRLRESDLVSYRTLRLTSLLAEPLAFGSTFERESGFDEARWVDRVTRGARSRSEAAWVAEGERGRLVGMIGAFTQDRSFHVFGMWVDPEFRRRGVGGRLLDTLLEWTRTTDPTAEVLLSVNPTQRAAVGLYMDRGFRATGVVEPLGHTEGAVVHEMRKVDQRTAPGSGR